MEQDHDLNYPYYYDDGSFTMEEINDRPASIEIISPQKEEQTRVPYPGHDVPTQCKVCGEAADGYHYDAASCNSCRAFFRRTIIVQKKFDCKRDKKCYDKMPSKTRVLCRACRFQKCVDVGMNPLAIRTKGKLDDNPIVQAILKKRKTDEVVVQPSTLKSLTTLDQQMNSVLDGLLHLEIKSDKLRKSYFNPNPHDVPTLRELLKMNVNFDIADVLGPMLNSPYGMDHYPHQGCLCHPEQMKHWLTLDLYLIVEYAKTFPFFNKLSDDDKVALLKGVCLLCYDLMQAFFSYDNKSDVIIHPDGTKITRRLKVEGQRKVRVPIEKRELVAPLIREKFTKEEYVLLKAILLCNPTVSNLSPHAVAVVGKERDKLCHSLLSLCLANFGAQGASRFATIIAMHTVLEQSAQWARDVHALTKLTRSLHKRILLIEDIME